MAESKSSYTWRPVSPDFLLNNYGMGKLKALLPITVWLLLTAATLFLTAALLQNDWLSLTANRGEIINFFILNPALIFGILLVFWLGFEWGFIPIYLCAFAVAYASNISVLWSSLIGIAFILGMGLFALSYHSFKVPYTLRSLKSVAFFIVVSFIAALASSMGSFIWSFIHQLSAHETLIVWKSWWTGFFFQSILITGPLLFFISPWVERKKREFFTVLPPQSEVSPNWVYGSVISVSLTLAAFIFSGYMLGRMNVREAIIDGDMMMVSDVMGSLEAFEIITWTSIGLIIVVGSAAIHLLNSWNQNLKHQVKKRTEDLEKSRTRLKNSLQEKDILFKEIQHRVKNNLAQVHGLLELQETMSSDQKVAELLKLSKSRIRTMSLAHEALYNNDDFSKISLKEYIENIAKVTHKSFKDNNKKIHLDYDVQDIHLDMGKAIPLGLMISEILINAHKHAFNGKQEGTIGVKTEINGHKMSLKIDDDGVGIPQDIDLRKSTSLGMTLVHSFSEQLRAKWDLDSNGSGTHYSFTIPLSSIVNN